MKIYRKMKWMLYISSVLLLLFLYIAETGPLLSAMKDFIYSSRAEPSYKHVILFDGGSTGTRIHVFTFVNKSGVLNLEDEYYKEYKPGLSNFADNPKDALVGISQLLEQAKSIIPSQNWNNTPIVLKATAGLRLLSRQAADSILQEIATAFKQSPFLYNEDSVSILDGEDEGLYAWYTLNFLLGKLKKPKESVVVLDLGGGSTQVTFMPANLDTFIYSPKGYIVSTKFQNKTFRIYSHSYLGLGLMTARLSILKINDEGKNFHKNNENNTFFTPCLPPEMKVTWKHDQKEYIIIGSTKEKYGYNSCYDKAVYFLSDIMHKPDELWKQEIYGLSYYYERAVHLGLIEGNIGTCTVGEFIDECDKACKGKYLEKWFLCLDCSYISALWQHGLAFSKNKEITFANRIHEMEASWALGAAFSILL